MDMKQAQAEPIGHLGLVAATIQDMEMMETIDQQLGIAPGGVKYGQRVGAMLLNGLGFVDTPLYMTPRFFHDKPLSVLLGEGVEADQLNDDSLGRCLDKIAKYGVTRWYSEVALAVVQKAGLLSNRVHLDSTTLSLYGAYDDLDPTTDPKPLQGYSKDHRPDLKQVTLQCVSMGKQALPIWMEALDGNSSDKTSFPETAQRVDQFYQALEDAPNLCFIADSALYSNQLETFNVDWITRVPEVSRQAKGLCAKQEVEWINVQDDRYQIYPYQPEGKEERWLLVRSEPAYHRENKTFLKKHARHFDTLRKSLWHCSCREFNCEADARKAVDAIIHDKKHFYTVDYEIDSQPKFSGKGRPKKGQAPDRMIYQVKIKGIASNYEQIQQHQATLGRFILATNVMDPTVMPDEKILLDYKNQSEIEQGFRFIKNDMIGLGSVYLKKPERIGALMAIMTLCLLIYGLTQYRLRTALSENNETLPDRKSKPTQTPTLMWIFTLFSTITMIHWPENPDKASNRIVLNMQPVHQKVVLLLGKTAKRIYLLPKELVLQDVKLNQKTWLKWCGM